MQVESKRHSAMILAAGLGKRMRSHNDRLPKPLVPVAGKPLLAYAFDLIRNAGMKGAVINTHYKAEMIAEWVKKQNLDVTLSYEEDLLETGGGVVKALPHLTERFFVINSDVINLECSSQETYLLRQMQSCWDDAAMDALLLLIPVEQAVGYTGAGDFALEETGHLLPRSEGRQAYVFTGIQLLHQRFLSDAPDGAFSLSPLYRKALEANPCRIFGLIHPGQWFHVGDGDGVHAAEMTLKLP